jgi:general secretion pathway protein H
MRTNARPFLPWGGQTGFTLVEILLVLALLALIGAVLLPAAGRMMPKSGGSWDDTVGEIFQQVRREAVVSGRELTLRFDPAKRGFVWPGGASPPLAPEESKLTVEFLRAVAGSSAILIGGQMVETTTVPLVRFYPDGTCDGVKVQWRAADTPPRILTIDPWTCAPGLEVKP